VRILIFNWRDIKNPNFGGAEIATHELARRWVKRGHNVTWLSACFANCKKNEVIDGIDIIREGSLLTVYFKAFLRYQNEFRGKIDVIIDQIHGLPFFTPLYVKEPKVAYIHEVAGPIWFWEWPLPIALLGFLNELFLFRLLYRKTNFITGSYSTLKDLKRVGIPKENIKIVRYGAPKKTPFKSYHKEKRPTLIYVGRIYRAKRVEEILKAVKLVIKKFPEMQFWIIGKGKNEYKKNLKKIARKLGIERYIKFYGFVSEKKKFELMSKAWIICATSVKEGWGLSIVEAASVGTPAVVYNVGGLKEVVLNNKTGIICRDNSPENLAQNILKLVSDETLRSKFGENAARFIKTFSWDKAAKEFLQILYQVANTS